MNTVELHTLEHTSRTDYAAFVAERECKALAYSVQHNVALVHCIEHMHAVISHYFTNTCKARSIEARMRSRKLLEAAYSKLVSYTRQQRLAA